MTRTYVALMSTGRLLRNGREYVSRRAARAAAARWEASHPGEFLAETRRADERTPHNNDAAGWDDYRLAHGYSGTR